MRDPIRMRELAPELDSALGDAGYDPPDGVEDDVWMRLESSLGTATSDAADPELCVPALAPVRHAAPSTVAKMARGTRAASSRQIKLVVGALAIAAVAILALRSASSRSDRIVTRSPTPVVAVTFATTCELAATAAPPEAPPPRPAPLPPEGAPPRAKPLIHSAESRRNAEVHATAKAVTEAKTLVPDPPPEVAPAPPEAPRSEPLVATSRPAAAKAKSGLLALEDGDLEGAAAAAAARRLVRTGDGHEALAQLALIEHKWPQAMRHEERECLRIEALAIAGRTAQAADAAAAFAEAYPKSPLLPRVQRALTNGQGFIGVRATNRGVTPKRDRQGDHP
jgi:hypothetical protein